ncbi:cation:proton antiporter [Haloferacaceae archaeon DSL9]
MAEILSTLTIIFATAGALLLLGSRLRLPIVPVYLLAGILVGGFIDPGELYDLAQWGIAFLVFLFGIEIELDDVRGIAAEGVGVAVGQAALTGGGVFALGVFAGIGPTNAVALAAAAGLSSSLVGVGHIDQPAGRRTTFERVADTIHFIEDLLAVGLLLVIGAVVLEPTTAPIQLGAGVGLFTFAVVARRFVFDRLVTLAEGDTEILMLTGVSLAIGLIVAADLAGLSIAIGAFAAGIAIPREYPHSIEMVDQLGYLRDFFAPVFFVTLGALVTLPTVETLLWTAVLLVAVLVVNPLLAAIVLLRRGYSLRTATLAGISLDQVSEFALIIAIELLLIEAITGAVFDAVVIAATATMFVASYTRLYRESIYGWLARTGLADRPFAARDSDRVPDDVSDHIVVFGEDDLRTGVFEAAADRPVVVVEPNPAATAHPDAAYTLVGDALDDDTIDRARAADAALVVSTIPDPTISRSLLDRDLDADVIPTAADVAAAEELFDAGAAYVLVRDELAADRLLDILAGVASGELTTDELSEDGDEMLERYTVGE